MRRCIKIETIYDIISIQIQYIFINKLASWKFKVVKKYFTKPYFISHYYNIQYHVRRVLLTNLYISSESSQCNLMAYKMVTMYIQFINSNKVDFSIDTVFIFIVNITKINLLKALFQFSL